MSSLPGVRLLIDEDVALPSEAASCRLDLYGRLDCGVFINTFYDAVSITATSCPADLDGDGTVSVSDLLIVLGAWDGTDGDITGDGVTNVDDLLVLLSSWGPCA